MDNAVPLGVHLFQKLLVLFTFRNDILTAYDHDTVEYPTPIITAESRQAVHAEPEESLIEELERLLSFELCEYGITASQGLEGLKFPD